MNEYFTFILKMVFSKKSKTLKKCSWSLYLLILLLTQAYLGSFQKSLTFFFPMFPFDPTENIIWFSDVFKANKREDWEEQG